ncbi:MAG TPA: DUF2537 domain-containing protein [Pseudonocardiaceae bacterium]|nr:DUF2537 domain-containing protein [Pseudonocardiaceae bacterium]
MELRVQGGRAVVAGRGESGEQEVDPHSLPVGVALADALHEWAKVADAVTRADAPADGAATALVTRRGRQLAVRLATAMGSPVGFTDPVTGEVSVVEAPVTEQAEPEHPEDEQEEAPQEPTPWGTGLTVSAFTAAVATFTVVSLSLALGETSRWLALIANILVVGGLAPSVWLARRVLIWRWVAYGVVAGVLMAWFALILTLL